MSDIGKINSHKRKRKTNLCRLISYKSTLIFERSNYVIL
jgi:hypothetical protein